MTIYAYGGSPSPNVSPVGSQYVCMFAFTGRPLTVTELHAFVAGQGLPSGAGYDPPAVLLEFEAPGSTPTLVEGPENLKRDGVGAYHVTIPVTVVNLWRWRGRGMTLTGEGVASTVDQSFRVTRTFGAATGPAWKPTPGPSVVETLEAEIAAVIAKIDGGAAI